MRKRPVCFLPSDCRKKQGTVSVKAVDQWRPTLAACALLDFLPPSQQHSWSALPAARPPCAVSTAPVILHLGREWNNPRHFSRINWGSAVCGSHGRVQRHCSSKSGEEAQCDQSPLDSVVCSWLLLLLLETCHSLRHRPSVTAPHLLSLCGCCDCWGWEWLCPPQSDRQCGCCQLRMVLVPVPRKRPLLCLPSNGKGGSSAFSFSQCKVSHSLALGMQLHSFCFLFLSLSLWSAKIVSVTHLYPARKVTCGQCCKTPGGSCGCRTEMTYVKVTKYTQKLWRRKVWFQRKSSCASWDNWETRLLAPHGSFRGTGLLESK